MTGHIALPDITGSDILSVLSRDITNINLLRSVLGFKLIIITDCLEMDAVAGKYGVESSALVALDAGAENVIICHTPTKQKGAVQSSYKQLWQVENQPLIPYGKAVTGIVHLK